MDILKRYHSTEDSEEIVAVSFFLNVFLFSMSVKDKYVYNVIMVMSVITGTSTGL